MRRSAGVSVTPARIAFAVTPSGASSNASCRMCDSSAAFAADTAPYALITRVEPELVIAKMRLFLPSSFAVRHVLRPVHEAVRHHVERHVHLLLADALLRVVGDERQQRPERERVHQHVARTRRRRSSRASSSSAAVALVRRPRR